MLDFKRLNRHAECIKSPKITTLSFEGKIGDLPSTVKVKWMNSRPSLKQHRCLCRQLSVSSLVCVTFDRAVAPGQIRIFRAALQKWSRSTCSSLLQYRSNGAQDSTLGCSIRLEWVQTAEIRHGSRRFTSNVFAYSKMQNAFHCEPTVEKNRV